MIHIDDYGFPVDETGDGGDSSMRAGVLAMYLSKNRNGHFSLLAYGINYKMYEDKNNPGWLLRHPTQVPWNSRRNFSRDQSLVLLAGLNSIKEHAIAKRFFFERAKSCFFAQNTEKDYPGTAKRLPEDYADPMFGNIGTMIIAGKIWYLYPLLFIFFWMHLAAIIFHANSNPTEENQILSECFLWKTLWLYKVIHPGWMAVSFKYWNSRNQVEYHNMLREIVG